MILWFLTTLYVLTRTKPATKYIILWKVITTSFKILLFLSGHLSQKNLRVLRMVTKMYILWCYTLYNFYKPCIFYSYIGIYDINSIKIGVFFTILGYETLFRTSLWHMTVYKMHVVVYRSESMHMDRPVLYYLRFLIYFFIILIIMLSFQY